MNEPNYGGTEHEASDWTETQMDAFIGALEAKGSVLITALFEGAPADADPDACCICRWNPRADEFGYQSGMLALGVYIRGHSGAWRCMDCHNKHALAVTADGKLPRLPCREERRCPVIR